jgi:RNA polymerase sigma factor (sigma-70 family)
MLLETSPGPATRSATGGVGSLALTPQLAAIRPMVRAVVARTAHLPLSHPDVDDAVAETLRRVVEGADRIRAGEPMAPWAAGIARHVALDYLRARRRDRARHAGDEHDADLADPAQSPEDRAVSADELARVRRALALLPEGPREAIVAFHVEGQSYQAIAARFGVPMGTVSTWIARGRKALGVAIDDRRVEEDKERKS